jgi:hypothetical protein
LRIIYTKPVKKSWQREQRGADENSVKAKFAEHHTGEVCRTPQRVEKVVVGPVGGPQEFENKAKTPQERCFSALQEGADQSAKEFFNTLVISANFAQTAF